jgi:hypothetical protein
MQVRTLAERFMSTYKCGSYGHLQLSCMNKFFTFHYKTLALMSLVAGKNAFSRRISHYILLQNFLSCSEFNKMWNDISHKILYNNLVNGLSKGKGKGKVFPLQV